MLSQSPGQEIGNLESIAHDGLKLAVLGARLTPSIGNLALWPAALMLLIVWLHLGWALWSIVKRERR